MRNKITITEDQLEGIGFCLEPEMNTWFNEDEVEIKQHYYDEGRAEYFYEDEPVYTIDELLYLLRKDGVKIKLK